MDVSTSGSICFYDYMNFCLYSDNLGFYNNPTIKFTKQSIFFTLPEYGKFFSFVIAKNISSLLRVNDIYKNVLEIGPGNGRLMIDILCFLQDFGIVISKYVILEFSIFLIKVQKINIKTLSLSLKVIWLKKIPYDFCGVVLFNEILDAIPISCFVSNYGIFLEKRVTYNKDKLQWIIQKTTFFIYSFLLTTCFRQINSDMSIFFFEFCYFFVFFIILLVRVVKNMWWFVVDYGYINNDYCVNQRYRGTLKCYFNNLTYNSPFLYPGLQDITFHINFTFFLNFCIIKKMQVCLFIRFDNFFLFSNVNYFIESLDICRAVVVLLKNEIRLLFLPEKMGFVFKVAMLMKNK